MRRDTLLDFFSDLAATRGEFLVYDDGFRSRSYTYAETANAARAFAARLQAAGIGKSDKVVFWSENRPEWIIALWGCILNGSIAVPIDYRASQEFLKKVARIVDAKLFLLGDDVDDLTNEGSRLRQGYGGHAEAPSAKAGGQKAEGKLQGCRARDSRARARSIPFPFHIRLRARPEHAARRSCNAR